MNKKWISCLLVVCICGLVFGCRQHELDRTLVSGDRPPGDKLTNIVIPDEQDAEAHKQLAYFLYSNANKLDQLCDKRAALSYCPVSTTMGIMDITVEAYVFDIKNYDEWFLLEYQVATSGLGMLASMFSNDMVFGRRSYYKLGWEEVVEQKVLNASLDSTKPYSDWEKANIATSSRIPHFHHSQELLYEKTEVIISLETILSAKVEYDITQGIFKINIELDIANPLTTSKTIVSLRKGAGNSAVYTSINEYIEIWDNGYYKSFLSTDKWKSKTLKSVLPYYTAYSYDDLSCDIHLYEEAKGLIALIKL